MGIRSLVSFGILAIPVAVTVGVLVGLDAFRTSHGMQRVFVNNNIENNTYCQKAYGIHPTTNGQQYTLNPNQWGWTEGTPGALCMNVTSFNNNTYATNASAPPFSVTWQYPQGPETQPVHAFPNILYDGSVKQTLPVQIGTLSSIIVDLKWSYTVGDIPSDQVDDAAMTAATVNTNVAIDMFLASNGDDSQNTEKATYEVMVWLAAFGAATQPIGFAKGAVLTAVVSNVNFNLYSGQNGFGQNVLTWVASPLQQEFSGDIAPLITALSQLTSYSVPTAADYLGYLGLGSEALYANTNVTFSVPKLAMTVNTQ